MVSLAQHTSVEIDGLTFFSDFDSGNLMRAVKLGPNCVISR